MGTNEIRHTFETEHILVSFTSQGMTIHPSGADDAMILNGDQAHDLLQFCEQFSQITLHAIQQNATINAMRMMGQPFASDDDDSRGLS